MSEFDRVDTRRKLRIGSLFSGIGMLELGLEAALDGRTVWQVESAAFPRSILAKHWPDASRDVTDVNDAGAHNLERVDLICGGFPCQNLSQANNSTQTGLNGEKSGLWGQYERIIHELRPRYVVVENNGPAWRQWVPVVRASLWVRGYSSVPIRLRASDVGAPHKRDRVFVVAWSVASDADGQGEPLRPIDAKVAGLRKASGPHKWSTDSVPLGVDDRGPTRVDRLRLRALGNAVVPQVAFEIGLELARRAQRGPSKQSKR